MKRLKIIVPGGKGNHVGMLSLCKLVDADTGEDIGAIRAVDIHLPFTTERNDIITATVEIVVAEIEAVPEERFEEVFGGQLYMQHQAEKDQDSKADS